MSNHLKYTKENQELRRGKCLELSSKGFNQSEISNMLGVSEGLISLDIQHIRTQARDSIRSYIDERLPEEYNKCLSGLNSILKESWTIATDSVASRDKIQALSLAKECYNAKLDLLTNVTVVEDVIKFVNKGKQPSVGFPTEGLEPMSAFQNANTEEEIDAEEIEAEEIIEEDVNQE